MSDESLFEDNIARFAASQPKVAYLLPYHDCSNVVACRTSVGEANLEKKSATGSYYVHSPAGALAEAKSWFSGLVIDDAEVVYVIGVGLGYGYRAAQQWLQSDQKRHIIFLEDDLSVLSSLFHTELGSELLSDPQVSLRYTKELLADKELSDWLCWDFVSKSIAVTALPSMVRHRRDLVLELQNKLMFDHHRFNEAIDEYLDHGVSYFRNFYANLLYLHQSYLGNGLFGAFKGVPAIICGAGPSLQQALPELHEMKGKAVIMAGGSAINALNTAGLQPHFGVGVDPNSYQYQRYVMQSAYEVPFFYRLRLNEQAFRLIHGPHLYLTGSGGYDVASWFESALGIESEDLDEGHNVVNFCAAIAQAMGCDPIIFVGLDLAYTGMQAYAPGIIHQPEVEEKHIIANTGVDKAAVQRTDIHGKPIYTLWKWIAESEWLSTFAKEHVDTTFLNATGGGLGIQGVENISLKGVLKDFLGQQRDISEMTWAAIQRSSLPADAKDRIDTAWKELDASLNRCVDKFDMMLSQLNSIWKQVVEATVEPKNLRTGLMAITELELEEEPAYHHVLGIFNEVFVRIINRELRQLKIGDASLQQKQLKQLELETRRYAFLRETAKVHREIMQQAIQESMV